MRRVYVAAATSGTAAGLLAGLALAGLDVEVVGVRVVGRGVANRARIRSLAKRAMQRWGRTATLGRLRLIHDWFEGGYGVATERVRSARDLGQGLGLPLETTYTGKAFGAAVAELAADPVDAVFVQTAAGPLPDPAPPLPSALEALLS